MVKKQRIKESTVEAVFIIDETDVIIGCNKAAEGIFGWPLEDIKGEMFSDLILPKETRKQFRDFLDNFAEAETKWVPVRGIEQNVLHHDGYEFSAKLIICLVDKQDACSFIITVVNVSEKNSKIQVVNQAILNQQIVNSILIIALEDFSLEEILFHALEHVLLLNNPQLVNKGAIFLVEQDSDYLVLRAHKGFDKKHLQACSMVPYGDCHCGRAAVTGEIQFSEYGDDKHDSRRDNLKPYGHYCVPICSGKNLLGVMSLYLERGQIRNDEEDDVLWAIGKILAGVIERKRIGIQRSQLIRQQNEMITRISDEKKLTESIIQSLNAGLMVCDRDGKIVTLNPSGRLILSQFIDSAISDLDNMARFADIPAVQLMRKIRTPSSEISDEVRLLNNRGEQKIMQYTVVPWENTSGQQIGIILLFRDITESLRLQQEMEKMNRLSTVAEIASAVAHEVRNPLAGIKTMSQAIDENCADNDENKEYITRIIKQVDRLNDLLTDFFIYAKPGEAKKEKVSIDHIVNEIRQLLRGRLDSKWIVLEEDYEEGLPAILVDPHQMQQVLLNLMLNAIDAIGTNGKVEIKARLADQKVIKKWRDFFPDLKQNIDYMEVYFKDNGKGMSSEIAAKAFEPFFTTKHHGSGLGLAIVYRILSENNAFIMVDSSQKKGVGFIMMFESVF